MDCRQASVRFLFYQLQAGFSRGCRTSGPPVDDLYSLEAGTAVRPHLRPGLRGTSTDVNHSGGEVAAPLHEPRPGETESQPHHAKDGDVDGGEVCAPPDHEPGPEDGHTDRDEDDFHLRLLTVCRRRTDSGSNCDSFTYQSAYGVFFTRYRLKSD